MSYDTEAFVVFLLGVAAVCLMAILYLGITSGWRGNSTDDFQREQTVTKNARETISSEKDALMPLSDSGPDKSSDPADFDFSSGAAFDDGIASDIIIINSNVNIISNSPGVTIAGDEQPP